jgi:excisionase family DNA binding protein
VPALLRANWSGDMTPHSLTIADTCRRYGFGKTVLYELIAAKKIDAVKQGTRTLVLADSVERHIASLPPASNPNRGTRATKK